MTERITAPEIHAGRPSIRKEYFIAVFLYLLPLVPLGLFIAFEESTQMVFFVLFLLSLLPCAIGGLALSIIGLRASWKNGSRPNRILGIIGTLGGLFCVGGGLLGPMLLYVVVGA